MSHVRLAEEGEARTVAELLAELPGTWGSAAPPVDALEERVRRLLPDPGVEFLVAGDPPAAVAQLRYRALVWLEGEECELEDLIVTAAARGRGLGKALVEATVERARARGCGRIHIVGNEANHPAIDLYRALGFSAWHDPPGGHNLALRMSL